MCAHASFIHTSVDDEDDDGGVSSIKYQRMPGVLNYRIRDRMTMSTKRENSAMKATTEAMTAVMRAATAEVCLVIA
jgi:hypothetical protein